MRTWLIILAAAIALAAPSSSSAGGLPWVHRAKCMVKLARCVDPPPRPGPQTSCPGEVQVGTVQVIWDPRLEAYVEWICTANGWRRLRIVPQQHGLPWSPPHPRNVIDYHRRCKAIVCLSVGVVHTYPTRWLIGRTP